MTWESETTFDGGSYGLAVLSRCKKLRKIKHRVKTFLTDMSVCPAIQWWHVFIKRVTWIISNQQCDFDLDLCCMHFSEEKNPPCFTIFSWSDKILCRVFVSPFPPTQRIQSALICIIQTINVYVFEDKELNANLLWLGPTKHTAFVSLSW